MFRLVLLLLWIYLTCKVSSLSQRNGNSNKRGGLGKCNDDRLSEINRVLMRLQIVGDKSFEPPGNEAEMRQYCINVKTLLKSFRRFVAECLHVVSREFSRVLALSIKRANRNICQSRSGRLDALEHVKCIRGHPVEGGIHQCAQGTALKAHWLSWRTHDQLDPDLFFPSICCLMHVSMDCVVSEAPKMCAGRVRDPQATAQFLTKLFKELAGEPIHVFCGRYSSLEYCHEHLPDVMERYNAIEKGLREGSIRVNASRLPAIAIPVLRIFERRAFTED